MKQFISLASWSTVSSHVYTIECHIQKCEHMGKSLKWELKIAYSWFSKSFQPDLESNQSWKFSTNWTFTFLPSQNVQTRYSTSLGSQPLFVQSHIVISTASKAVIDWIGQNRTHFSLLNGSGKMAAKLILRMRFSRPVLASGPGGEITEFGKGNGVERVWECGCFGGKSDGIREG